ncbi:ABC transporter permease [Dyadobacter chenwenxiniae]|uniref:ABC transporter permease n=1 Tax=Dyadobacter chenwenxiniae TaxID=2906456 RepID=A0A9X1TI75_9BACT|nr:ABC transporter permease [Dyadobacter chenwenxiniae]MCF0065229.1 ABC transporter permease [Dyadobacter chenwenxiniae]UON84501.1 ABC transporter permease [Dyadobacter chenwenxiniae]
MIRNYFKIAWRNVRSGGWYSTLNIGGLAVVLAVSLLLFWWVKDELTFDRFHSSADRIYQINARFGKGTDENTFTSTPGPVAVVARKQIPEVESVVRMGYYPGGTFRANGKTFNEKDNLVYTETSFLEIFDGFKVLYGNEKALFPEPNSVVLTRKLATKFFGNADAVGKTFENIETHISLTVSAVIEDAPDNSSLRHNMYVNLEVLKNTEPEKGERELVDENWDNYGFETYVKLGSNVRPENVAKKLTSIQASVLKGKPNLSDYQLQPLTDIHLYPVEGNGSVMKQVSILGVVAVLLLSIGCINYVNLTTARATRRCKEIGIRKVVGAGSAQLARQLLVESLLTLGLALILSIVFLQALLPLYASLTGKSGSIISLLDPQAWQMLVGSLAFCFLLAGIYPAVMVAKFNPIQALKGHSGQANGAVVRKLLVVKQFALATTLIVGTFIIGSQLRFIRERDPGFKREHVFTFNGRNFTPQFKQALGGQSSVSGISTSTDTPVNIQTGTASVDWDGKEKDRTLIMVQMGIDKDFISNFGIKILAGRDFSGSKSDSAHFILNETAVKETGIVDPVGKRFKHEGTEGTIIGIVKDFNITTIREPIWPLVMFSKPEQNYIVNVHTTGERAPAALGAAEKLWKQYLPAYPFEYTFLDANYNDLYRSEQQTGKLFNVFAGIAIVISCLGLLGLASFITEQRTKEIGIRKVLGATVLNVTTLLSKDFMKLVVVAIVIATPIAWFLMEQWLKDFAYKITIQWWMFLLAGCLSIITALLTISVQSVKAALADPVKSIKSE